MDRIFDFTTVKDRPELDNGTYDFAIEGFVEGQTQAQHLASLRLNLRVTGPAAQANLPWSELYTLGSEGDPDGLDPQKLADSPGMRGLKRLGRACGLDMDQRWQQTQLIAAILASGGFTAHIQKSPSKKDPTKMYSNIDRYYKLHEVPAKLDGPATRTAATATASVARPNGPAGPARVAAPTPVRPVAPAAALPEGFSIEE